MGFYSVQLNDDDVVVAVVDSAEPISGNKIVALDSFDSSVAGKKYNRETLAFDEIPLTDDQLAEQQIQEEIKRIKAENETMIRDEAISNLTTAGKMTVVDGVVSLIKEG